MILPPSLVSKQRKFQAIRYTLIYTTYCLTSHSSNLYPSKNILQPHLAPLHGQNPLDSQGRRGLLAARFQKFQCHQFIICYSDLLSFGTLLNPGHPNSRTTMQSQSYHSLKLPRDLTCERTCRGFLSCCRYALQRVRMQATMQPVHRVCSLGEYFRV